MVKFTLYRTTAWGSAQVFGKSRREYPREIKRRRNGSISDPDDYAVMRSVIEQIIVRKDSMEIEFKCGVSITKEYVR